MKKKPEMILAVNASEFPKEIEDWCCEGDISTHYQNDVIQIWKDDKEDDIFVKWFESKYDYKFDRTKITSIAVFAT